jgi:hypothetical protein
MRTGFKWDLCYKGKVYPVTFILFVPFIKGDIEEHDKHCGKYLSRTEKVAQLCRYCQCPTTDTDNPSANYPPKTQELIENLVDEHDLEGLQQLSQHYMRNAWYDIFFGTHNKMGVHGGTPSEMLHALLLGLYKYCRAIFFFYVGPDSQAADTINAIAKQYGKFFKHQSDRDMPRTNFAKGIKKGKLMAKEFAGLILILLVVLRSTRERETVLKGRSSKKHFQSEAQVQDWIILLERLLGWHRWLCQPRILVTEVNRSKKKHRSLLALFKKIARRVKGMGLKLMKFHVVTHMADDILNFGELTLGLMNRVTSLQKQQLSKHRRTKRNLTNKPQPVVRRIWQWIWLFQIFFWS